MRLGDYQFKRKFTALHKYPGLVRSYTDTMPRQELRYKEVLWFRCLDFRLVFERTWMHWTWFWFFSYFVWNSDALLSSYAYLIFCPYAKYLRSVTRGRERSDRVLSKPANFYWIFGHQSAGNTLFHTCETNGIPRERCYLAIRPSKEKQWMPVLPASSYITKYFSWVGNYLLAYPLRHRMPSRKPFDPTS